MCQHGLPGYVAVILRWWLCLSGMTDTTPLVLWCWLVVLRSLV
ncbi:hypothetical protein ACVQZV_001857 [Escherichia coli]